MKRILVLALAAMLLFAGMAQADWGEGKGPSKPYDGVPEVNLEEQMGYMMFYPNASMEAQSACQKLFIYLPREDLKVGDGTFYLANEQDGQIFSCKMNETDHVTQRPITESELNGLLWGGGTCFEIQLPVTLELGKSYFVNMTRNCILTEDGKIDNPEVGGTDAWAFTLSGEHGVSKMEYLRGEEGTNVVRPAAGDKIRFDLEIGGDATMAVIYGYGDTVDFVTTMFTESTEVIGEVMAADPAWGVMFLDANGEEVARVEFW